MTTKIMYHDITDPDCIDMLFMEHFDETGLMPNRIYVHQDVIMLAAPHVKICFDKESDDYELVPIVKVDWIDKDQMGAQWISDAAV